MGEKMEMIREETARRLPQYQYESSASQGYWWNTETKEIVAVI